MSDFRKILIAYINHVLECESVTFLPASVEETRLSRTELAALYRAAAESDCSLKHSRELLAEADKLEKLK